MSAAMETLLTFAKWLVPPPDAEHPRQYAHRVRVTIVVCGLFMAGAAFLSWFFHDFYPQVATREEIVSSDQTIEQQIAQWIKTSNDRWGYELRKSVLQMDEARCALPTGSPLRAQYNREIDDGVQRYQRVTGDTSFKAQACGDL